MLQTAMSSPLPPGGDPFEGSSYRWLRHLGGGGMGEVHLVEHRALGSEFVAKVLHARYASDAQLADRVRVEAQSLARLEHPNIVQVKSFALLADGRPFIVMEPLSGDTLESEIQTRERLPLVEALRYGLQLASALAAAHALGIVHRDIKPNNLFLHHDYDGLKVLKVLDFGVARILPGFSDNSPVPLALPTDTGIVVGTPRYVSPEGALGKRVDHRADIYGAGLVLYIMLTGRGPFDHVRGEQRVLVAHVHEAPRLLSTYGVGGGTPALQDLVSHALAKNPDDRLPTAKELEARLALLLQQAVAAARRTSAPPAAPAVAAPSAPKSTHYEDTETPAPLAAIPTVRSPASVMLVFVTIALIVGLASAGAVTVLRRLLGGP